jgi:hypothetical protein
MLWLQGVVGCYRENGPLRGLVLNQFLKLYSALFQKLSKVEPAFFFFVLHRDLPWVNEIKTSEQLVTGGETCGQLLTGSETYQQLLTENEENGNC